jgi:hypothetical protein
MNTNSDIFLNNLYNHLNTNQSYYLYNTSSQLQTKSHVNQNIYDKLLHDFQNYST